MGLLGFIVGSIALVVSGVVALQPQVSVTPSFGGAGNEHNDAHVFNAGLTAADSTFNGGLDALTLTSTNTATSSFSVGCIDYANGATSTASPAKLLIVASSTSPHGTGLEIVPSFGSCS